MTAPLIRKFEEGDLPVLLEMAKEFWKDAGTGLEFEEEACRDSFFLATNFGFTFVAEVEGEPIGFISCIEAPLLASSKKVCSEMAWYVKPSHRGTGAGLWLLREAELEAKVRGCHILAIFYMETSMPESIKRIYEKLGFELQETTYRKILWA